MEIYTALMFVVLKTSTQLLEDFSKKISYSNAEPKGKCFRHLEVKAKKTG
jgi:hypothetical protein